MSDHEPDDSAADRYLWDGTGAPDDEIVRLEKALSVLRHAGSPPVLPARAAPVAQPRRFAAGRWLAAAAALILVTGGTWIVIAMRSAAWDVNSISGAPAVAGRAVSGQRRLARGEWLVTDGASRARIAVGGIGSVDVEPNTRLQLIASGGREHRMTLERGTIHARIWAPPKLFFVNTQAAVAVDLGCAYTLHVDEDGAGVLRVASGWVGLERAGRDTYIPEGAVCATRADVGPGTPRYEDAPSGYGEALMTIDFGAPGDPRRTAAFDLVLGAARRRDAMTLWHLLVRGSLEERSRVYDRLATLAPPPDGVTRDAILRGDRTALNKWWDWLGIEASTWWRLFKKKW